MWCVTNSLLLMDKSIHYCAIVKQIIWYRSSDTLKCVSFKRNCVKMLKNDICNTEFEVGQAFYLRVMTGVYIQNMN